MEELQEISTARCPTARRGTALLCGARTAR
jgi:hypothetical protein